MTTSLSIALVALGIYQTSASGLEQKVFHSVSPLSQQVTDSADGLPDGRVGAGSR